MNMKATLEFLQEVFEGKVSLRALVGREYEGRFGDYHLAGVIASARMQEKLIFINWQMDAPGICYVEGLGMQFRIGNKVIDSTDFVID